MAIITGYGSKHSHEFKLVVNEISTDVINNTSEVSFEFTLYKSSYSWSGWNSITYKIVINGTEYTGTISAYTAGATLTIKSGTQTILHNDDGKKSIDCSFSVTDNSGQSYTCGNASSSGTVELSTIPRSSSISCTTANVEETAIVTINSASVSFRHSVYAYFGSQYVVIAENKEGGSFSWNIPKEFYSEIKNAKSGTGSIVCETFNNGILIGAQSSQLTVTTNEEKCRPSISATVVDTNSKTIELTGNNKKLIKYKSTAKITISSSAKNSASISTKKVNSIDVKENNISIKEVETDTFVVTVTDSRGYSNSVTLKPSMINYIPLSINANIKRTQPTTGEVDVSFSGNYFNGSFGNTDNELSMKWFYRENGASEWTEGGNISVTIKDNTYSNGTSKISLGKIFDYQKSYEIYLEVADKLITSKSQHSITQGIPIFNWGKNFFNINGMLMLNGENINGTVLYEDDEGTNGTVYLSESVANFERLKIFFKDIQKGIYSFVEVCSANNKTVELSILSKNDNSSIRANVSTAIISDKTIKRDNSIVAFLPSSGLYNTNEINILKVIGYR